MRLALGIAWTSLVVAYPIVVYVGLEHWQPHVLSLVLLGMLGALSGLKYATRGETGAGRRAFPVGWLSAVLLVLGAVLRQSAFVKAVPVLVSGGLLVAFGLSLNGEQSMVERFARRVDPELSADKVRYCRRVTIVWCGFFVFNIAVTLGLSFAAPTAWWTVYTGIVAYVLIGTLFTVEYVVRKAIFRDYGTWWHDRAIAAVFPPRIHEPQSD